MQFISTKCTYIEIKYSVTIQTLSENRSEYTVMFSFKKHLYYLHFKFIQKCNHLQLIFIQYVLFPDELFFIPANCLELTLCGPDPLTNVETPPPICPWYCNDEDPTGLPSRNPWPPDADVPGTPTIPALPPTPSPP